MDTTHLGHAATRAASRAHLISLSAQPDAGRFLRLILELGQSKKCFALRTKTTTTAASTSRGLS
jgi:hypothetical protein